MPADFKSHIFAALLNAWYFVIQLAPYLIAGILLAALLNTFMPGKIMARAFSVRKWWVLPAAGLAGTISPACTYGTVPLFVEMIRNGAPAAPAATFLVASGLVNPHMFMIIVGALGLWVAVAQAAASLIFAVAIGAIVARLDNIGLNLLNPENIHDTACRRNDSKHNHIKRAWPYRLGKNILDLAEFIGFYFLIGVLIAAMIAEFVPSWVITSAVGQGKWWAVPFAAIVSLPTYVCGGGTIPILAKAQELGMALGAVLAFLIAGPATRITALASLAMLFRKRAVISYVIIVLAFAIIMGHLLSYIVVSNPKPIPPRFL